MKLPKWATTVTPFSKMLALSMLVIFPIIAFILGMKYQAMVDNYQFATKNQVKIIENVSPQPTVSQAMLPTFSPSRKAYWFPYNNGTYWPYTMSIPSDFYTKADHWNYPVAGTTVTFQSPAVTKKVNIPTEDWFDLQITSKKNVDHITTKQLIDIVANDISPKNDKLFKQRVLAIKNSFKPYKNGDIDGYIGDSDGYENPNITIIQAKPTAIYIIKLLGGPNTGTPVTETAKKTLDLILSTFKY